jgi:hypothetical protein
MPKFMIYICPECGTQLDPASKRGCAHWPRHREVEVVPRAELQKVERWGDDLAERLRRMQDAAEGLAEAVADAEDAWLADDDPLRDALAKYRKEIDS